eukprot:scaffold2430_cov116-Skeletonema_dohrnii-CCMP3373.AAC.1
MAASKPYCEYGKQQHLGTSIVGHDSYETVLARLKHSLVVSASRQHRRRPDQASEMAASSTL